MTTVDIKSLKYDLIDILDEYYGADIQKFRRIYK